MLNSIPYFAIFLVPVLGCFFGRSYALSLSILLILHYVFRSIFLSHQIKMETLLNLILGVAIVIVPVSFIPFSILWVYDKFLWCLEPLWQCVEVVGVLRVVMELSETVQEEIEIRPLLAKLILLTWSVLCYCSAIVLLYNISKCSSFYLWLLVCLILCLSICHFLTLWIDVGILSDVATVSLISIAFLSDGCLGLHSSFMVSESSDSNRLEGYSFFALFIKAFSAPLAQGTNFLAFLKHIFSLVFVVTGFVRFLGMFCVSNYFLRHLWGCDDPDDDADETDVAYFTSPVKAVMCIVYTQFLVHHLNRVFVTEVTDNGSLMSAIETVLNVFHWGRLLQSFAICFIYLYMLKRKEQDKET